MLAPRPSDEVGRIRSFKIYGILDTPFEDTDDEIGVIDSEKRQLRFEQGEALRRLSRQVLAQLESRRRLVDVKDSLHELDAVRPEIAQEKARSDELLEITLPRPVVEGLKLNEKVEPRYYPAARILSAAFKGFSTLAEHVEPAALVMLSEGCLDESYREARRRSGHGRNETRGF